MPKGHKVVTVERQGGYAARCETCGDITFGGFTTRTEARAALTHEEALSAAGTAAEGEDQNTNTHEGEPIMNIIADTPEIRTAIREWAEEYRRRSDTYIEKLRADEQFQAWAVEQYPAGWDMDDLEQLALRQHLEEHPVPFPTVATPEWATVTCDTEMGGEVLVTFESGQSRDGGPYAYVAAAVSIVVNADPTYDKNHKGGTVGDLLIYDNASPCVTIHGAVEDMPVDVAVGLFDSLAEAVTLLRQIEAGIRL